MRLLAYISFIFLLGSCGVIRNIPKFGLQDGGYQTNQEKVFIETQNDTTLFFSENGKQERSFPISTFIPQSNFTLEKPFIQIISKASFMPKLNPNERFERSLMNDE
jgi:hypothetical protein